MSGGVDSSVAALLLIKEGFEVEGCTLRLLSERLCSLEGAGAPQALEDAESVCAQLGIKHRILDLSALFEREVVSYFAFEYLRGRTPNPCLVCNRRIKLGAMLDYALEQGFDAVATGHYSRVCFDEGSGKYQLRRSISKKDQSYFLYSLSQHQLSHLVLPIASMDKTELRDIARREGLEIYSKPDSQDICFVRDSMHSEFLRAFAGAAPPRGAIVDHEGRVVGQHEGIDRYTIGQRKGLGGGFAEPMFVSSISPASGTVHISPSGALYKSSFTCEEVNIISGEALRAPTEVLIKVRYAAPAVPALVTPLDGGRLGVETSSPVRALTPGQAAVFYTGEDFGTVLGGGIIK